MYSSCEKLNSLNLKTYWEIDIFPTDRLFSCRKKFLDLGINTRDSTVIKKISARYAEGFKISYK